MVKRETLDGGAVLNGLIAQFHNEQSEQNALAVLRCLRDSYIIIPCRMEMSERDQAKFLNSKPGDEVTTEDDVRYIPDTLSNGENEYFPVFSNEEAMGEYGEQFCKIEQHFFDAMALAKSNEKLKGIVVNAFTQQFIVEKDLFDLVAGLPTNVEGE